MGFLGSTLLGKLWVRIVTHYRVVVYCHSLQGGGVLLCRLGAAQINRGHSHFCVKNASRSTCAWVGVVALFLQNLVGVVGPHTLWRTPILGQQLRRHFNGEEEGGFTSRVLRSPRGMSYLTSLISKPTFHALQ